jgi:hypothetical protein
MVRVVRRSVRAEGIVSEVCPLEDRWEKAIF